MLHAGDVVGTATVAVNLVSPPLFCWLWQQLWLSTGFGFPEAIYTLPWQTNKRDPAPN